MSWVRVDDKAWCHPKLATLSGAAVKLWLFALCWCNQHETDGKVPAAVLTLLGGTTKSARELVEAGLWHADEVGMWEFHDYLKYQPSRAKLTAEREATKARVERFRKRDGNAVGNGARNGDGTPRVTPLPTGVKRKRNAAPVPSRPVPSQPDQPESVSAEDLTVSARGSGSSAPSGKDPSASARGPSSKAHSRTNSAKDSGDSERTCPVDLVEKAQSAGVFSSLAARWPEVTVEQLEDSAWEFVGYWTTGAGTGETRPDWLKKLREHLRKTRDKGRFKPPGELEHERTKAGDDDDLSPAELRSAARAKQRILEAEGKG